MKLDHILDMEPARAALILIGGPLLIGVLSGAAMLAAWEVML